MLDGALLDSGSLRGAPLILHLVLPATCVGTLLSTLPWDRLGPVVSGAVAAWLAALAFI